MVSVDVRSEEIDFRAGGRLPESLALSSGTLSLFALLESIAETGVLGVRPAVPKLANAPLPRPKADLASVPVEGGILDVVIGEGVCDA